MTLKKTCSCGVKLTTKNVRLLARNEVGLWFNCKCGSTGLILSKETKQTLGRVV